MSRTALKDGEILFLNQRVIYFSHSDFWQLGIELNKCRFAYDKSHNFSQCFYSHLKQKNEFFKSRHGINIPRNAVFAVEVSQHKSEFKLHFSVRKNYRIQISSLFPLWQNPSISWNLNYVLSTIPSKGEAN